MPLKKMQSQIPAKERLINELTINNLNSLNYVIKTKAISDLEEKLMELMSIAETGAIVYGRPRVGKTHAIEYITRSILKTYGEEIPVVKWNLTDHIATERAFYSEVLMALGCVSPTKGATAMILKERTLNELVIRAGATIYKKLVFFIDEAWLLDIRDFQWLMDLYNRLADHRITMTCFLFGTKEIIDLKRSLKQIGKEQIVQRFMLHEYHLKGMRNQSEIMLCLADLDEQLMVGTDEGDNITLLQFYFPEAAQKGHMFIEIANDYYKAFMDVREKFNLLSDDIPMKYFTKSFTYLLHRHGRLSEEPIFFPEYKNIVECIRASEYGQSNSNEYTEIKGTNKKKRR